jgi:AraC-like DNA-binding protein
VVRTILARGLERYLERMGVDGRRLMIESGLDPDYMQDPDGLISFRACADMWERAARETGREALGVEFALQMPWEDLGILGYVMFNAPTVDLALDSVSRFYSSMRILGDLHREEESGEVHFSLWPQGVEPGGFAQMEYLLFALFLRFGREATGVRDLAPRRVSFVHAAPFDTSTLEAHFRAPIEFSASVDSFSFSVEDVGLKLGAARPNLYPGLRRHAQSLLASMPPPSGDVDEIRRCTTAALGDGIFQIDEIARRLGTSARTVQRRLQQAGTSFHQIIGDARLSLAQLYLKDPALSLSEIAFLLGYSHQSVMSRAYRRWSGQRPLTFRKRSAEG